MTAAPPPPLSPLALNRALLARQLLLSRSPLPALAAIDHLAGLQAQLARPPFIGLWTRLASFERASLSRLLHDRRAVRATFLRGTLHLVSSADFLALRGALQPMLAAGMRAILKDRVAALDLAALATFARTKLPATFEDLRPLLAKQFPKFDERALGYAVRMCLPLVQVPTDDPWAFPSAAAFADASTWLAAPVPVPVPDLSAEAPAASTASADVLVRRYLAAFGPATVRDAQRWSGLPDLKPTFERLRPSLVTFRDDKKRELFDLPDAPRPSPDSPAPIRFVPDFDNLVLGHDDRRRIIADEHRPRLTTKNLQVKATFLVDGFVAGTWKIDRTKRAASLALSPFGKLSRALRASLEEEGERLLSFVEPDAPSRSISVAPG